MTYGWAVPVILGVPGNLIALAVASKKANRELSPCTYMAAMAVVDTILLLEEAWIITLMRLLDRSLISPPEFFIR
jgi:di/tricarboxylate transporter